MLMESKFHPPIIEQEIIGFHELPNGEVDRTTMLLTDNDDHKFSLTIATAKSVENLIRDEFENEGEQEDAEPIFVVPDNKLDPEIIDDVLKLPARLLGKFLVEQSVSRE